MKRFIATFFVLILSFCAFAQGNGITTTKSVSEPFDIKHGFGQDLIQTGDFFTYPAQVVSSVANHMGPYESYATSISEDTRMGKVTTRMVLQFTGKGYVINYIAIRQSDHAQYFIVNTHILLSSDADMVVSSMLPLDNVKTRYKETAANDDRTRVFMQDHLYSTSRVAQVMNLTDPKNILVSRFDVLGEPTTQVIMSLEDPWQIEDLNK